MFHYDLIFALRNIARNKMLGAIKITGLVVGITACLVVFLIASFELSFDRFQPDRNRVYRVYTENEGSLFSGAPTAIHSRIKNDFTGVESVCNFHTWNATVKVFSVNDVKDLGEHDRIIITPHEYFDVFNYYKWLVGGPQVSLGAPSQVVLTESRARLYFGGISPSEMVGREIHYNDSLIVTVSGIVKDIQQRTDFNFTDFISFGTIESTWLKKSIQDDRWNSVNSSSQLFIKLSSNTPASQIEQQISGLTKIYNSTHKNPWGYYPRLQPLADLHFNPTIGIFDHSRPAPERSVLNMLMIVALLLLSIAIVNYVNLETAQATRRAKEVGIRKTLGSSRTALITQFLIQSLIFSGCAILISPALAWVVLHNFKDFIPPGLELNIADPALLIFLFCCMVAVTLLAGLYPAFVLSSYQPARALKNLAHINTSMNQSAFVRKGLTIFQFSFSQILIIATIAIGVQVNYLLNKDLGFSSAAVIYFYTPPKEPADKKFLLKNTLSRLPEIESISLAMPPTSLNASSTITFDNGKEMSVHDVFHMGVDTAYLKLYNIQLLAGRNFLASDSAYEYLINETFLHRLGYHDPREALGKSLNRKYTIAGVVKDFHSRSLHSVIDPLVIRYNGKSDCIAMKLVISNNKVADLGAPLKKIEGEWKKIYPDNTIQFRFLDDTIKRFYETELRTNKLMTIAAAVTILISCLGLFALSSFTVIQRTKEISIRKVVGGSVQSIVILLSKDFLKHVIIAFIVAAPLAYYLIDQWLERFAFRQDLSIWTFVIAGALSVLTAFFTVGSQTIKAAKANPVKYLRSE